MAVLYILQCRDDHWYCGSTLDFGRRLTQHAEGLGSRFCARWPPIRVASTCVVPNETARDEERALTMALGKLFGADRVNRPEDFEARREGPSRKGFIRV